MTKMSQATMNATQSASPARSAAGNASPSQSSAILMKTISNAEITRIEDLDNMIALVKEERNGVNSKYTFTYIKVEVVGDKVEITSYADLSFKHMSADSLGISLPYMHKKLDSEGKTMDVGPARPITKIVLPVGQPDFNFQVRIDMMVRAGYEFTLSRMQAVFPEVLGFTYRPVKIPAGRGQTESQTTHEVLIVLRDGSVKSLSEYLDSITLNDKQTEFLGVLAKNTRIKEIDVFLESAPTARFKTFTFHNLTPEIHEKSGKLFQEMLLRHNTFPDEKNRHYRKSMVEADPAMQVISNWGIVIQKLVPNGTGGLGRLEGSDWTKEAGFAPNLNEKTRNSFVGRFKFNPEAVRSGKKGLKVTYRCSVLFISQSSKSKAGDFDEEDVVPASVGVPVSLTGSKAAQSIATLQSNQAVTGTIVVADDDDA